MENSVSSGDPSAHGSLTSDKVLGLCSLIRRAMPVMEPPAPNTINFNFQTLQDSLRDKREKRKIRTIDSVVYKYREIEV
ncbi:hypothetical protein V9T40_013089 [Parthenolecanium corni]|uniref:Uncharacterized protein n=1 Tax=Parthenolecanium corni TaxID=536013 RepID=A0AAN9TIG5_9HEMI